MHTTLTPPNASTDTNETKENETGTGYEIFVRNLTFTFVPLQPDVPPSLVDIALALPKGSRTILIGANGGACSGWLVGCL